MYCACGLTREKLFINKCVNYKTGFCTAIYTDKQGVLRKGCNKLYGEHPSNPFELNQGYHNYNYYYCYYILIIY